MADSTTMLGEEEEEAVVEMVLSIDRCEAIKHLYWSVLCRSSRANSRPGDLIPAVVVVVVPVPYAGCTEHPSWMCQRSELD